MSEPEKTSSAAPTSSDTQTWSDAVAFRDLTGMTLGDFEVERLLGRGGMGEVYLARQISLNRPVALKVLRPDMLTRPDYLKRFEAEAAAVAKLNHPNIVHIYTLGMVDDVRFIAMEYVQGTNLRDYIVKKGALDLPLALSIMRQAGVAIGAAGERGLIHRDVKPENLLLTRKGQVKVADFGLCRDQEADVHHTQPGVTLGTPQYMSPEQVQGHALDHRSDLYSLGVTFYHMLAGVVPFRGDTPIAVALKHLKDVPASISVHRPDIPPELDRLVMKLMSKKPADRYQSAAEMLRDLAKVREALHAPSVAVPAPDAGTAIVVNPAAATLPMALPSKAEVARRLRELRLGGRTLAAIVAGCLVAGLAWGWLSRPPDLLSEASEAPRALPGLWIDPRWREVPRKRSAEEQYHAAQLGATAGAEAEAAWLAVPGHFPGSRDWSSRAYVQLGRLLLRRHDVDRLRVLAAEVARWNPDVTHERELAEILQAGVKALNGDVEGVIDDFNGNGRLNHRSLIDPALLELSLEVTATAALSASKDGATPPPPALREIQKQLLDRFYFEELRIPLGRARAG
jgi:serine/threonine-protein kinase